MLCSFQTFFHRSAHTMNNNNSFLPRDSHMLLSQWWTGIWKANRTNDLNRIFQGWSSHCVGLPMSPGPFCAFVLFKELRFKRGRRPWGVYGLSYAKANALMSLFSNDVWDVQGDYGGSGPEVSPIKCDVRECVVRTSDSLENLTF